MAILDFASGGALQAVSKCPGAARLVFYNTFKLTEHSKPSFGSLPKVKTKDDLLKMLHTIRTDETDKYPEMEIEDWN